MKDFEKDGESITKEEAEEIAKMEIGAKEIKRYEQSDKPKKERKAKERKIDINKSTLIQKIYKTLEENGCCITTVKNESELNFDFENENYTIKLIRHRKK